jgi:hypothetical protein
MRACHTHEPRRPRPACLAHAPHTARGQQYMRARHTHAHAQMRTQETRSLPPAVVPPASHTPRTPPPGKSTCVPVTHTCAHRKPAPSRRPQSRLPRTRPAHHPRATVHASLSHKHTRMRTQGNPLPHAHMRTQETGSLPPAVVPPASHTPRTPPPGSNAYAPVSNTCAHMRTQENRSFPPPSLRTAAQYRAGTQWWFMTPPLPEHNALQCTASTNDGSRGCTKRYPARAGEHIVPKRSTRHCMDGTRRIP